MLANTKSFQTLLDQQNAQRASEPAPASSEDNQRKDDDVAYVDRISIVRRYHRNIDLELYNIVQEFDSLLMFRERFLTPQFQYMIHCIIFIYVTLYPWCVQNESAAVLGFTSLGMGFVFYGLNHMTNGLEDPMKLKGQGFNLALTFQHMWAVTEKDDSLTALAMKFLREKRLAGSTVELTESLHDEFVETMCQKRETHEARQRSRAATPEASAVAEDRA